LAGLLCAPGGLDAAIRRGMIQSRGTVAGGKAGWSLFAERPDCHGLELGFGLLRGAVVRGRGLVGETGGGVGRFATITIMRPSLWFPVPRMSSPQISLILTQAAHEVLMWVGFGTLVGLAAKAIMPGRDPGGALGTTLMGIVGSVLGCGVVAFFCHGRRIMPISLAGFAAGTGGAFIILLFYRLLAGNFFVEAEDGERIMSRATRARRRRLLREG